LNHELRGKELAEMLNWHEMPEPLVSWEVVETGLQAAVPDGLKEISSVFPSGSFGGRMHFYNPIQSRLSCRAFLTRVGSKGDTYRYSREIIPEEFPYRFHPEPSGLVPWGFGDQHTYFWRPGEEQVLFADNHGDRWGQFDGGIPAFLVDLFAGAVAGDLLYDEWPTWRFYVKFPESAYVDLAD